MRYRNIAKRVAICLVVLQLIPAVAIAGPDVTEDEVFYGTDGNTVEELRAAMSANSPETFWGYTRWYVNWSASCNVSLKITYTLPVWTGYGDADQGLKDRWDTFLQNLVLHERGHGEHGRRAASEIEKTNCRDDPYGIIESWAEQNKTYDADTQHGATQGATL